ncbi:MULTISPECIES: hypothetical protein [Streptomyces]|uniref:hypothetical protein n=1 Tax=Streptomyces TaxID=1883 RepID=UPI001675EF3D|nr:MULTISPECIES: hypothetical protein [Streptomyces]MBK3525083.1 hypothetical protein [Streptomyces sp. MBT70]GGR78302.1 hypothetical protein GCM10010236_36330 [Streptomyces eurythermus]
MSAAADGTGGDSDSARPQLGANGRYIAFESWPANLAPGDTDGARDHFAGDLTTGVTRRLSLAHDGSQTNDDSGAGRPHPSAGNRYAVFTSTASDLVPGDTNGRTDVFVRRLR